MHSSTTILFFKIPIRQKRKQVKDRSKVDSAGCSRLVGLLRRGENSEPGWQLPKFSEVPVIRGHLAPRPTESPGSAAEGQSLSPLGRGRQLVAPAGRVRSGAWFSAHRAPKASLPAPRPRWWTLGPIHRHTFDFKTCSGSPAAIRFYF